MEVTNRLAGKKILIVDDEVDVLESLAALLPQSEVVKATAFEEAKRLLETQDFDMAILDIMGVDGYELLKIARRRKVIAVMLTAHALSPDNVIRSYTEGAAYYLPKEGMSQIESFLNEVLEAVEKGKSPWSKWLNFWASLFEKRYGQEWQRKDKDFWEKFPNL